ncbi:hypothetical protein [Lactiplantibacillus songbeiensis]|uniref:D-alanyl-D-alanine carboxypeptidase n=1 Tax=Lactiplantibacillus songbeiensis TaxID=2559920 RepID=A0ABW4BXW0_9LACO|nr:hypothetical protein [Lactiplantibacillus songbeiensis]
MKKFVKAGLMLVLGLTLVAPGMTTPANAASKVKVVSTTGIAKTAYHGKKGYIYSSAKLTKKKHNMRNYKYTTWYGTKKATIKKTGKKQASLTYIKAGKKHGWIYSKYLTAGKAPVNTAKIRQNEVLKYNKYLTGAGDDIQSSGVLSVNAGYGDIGSDISYKWDFGPLSFDVGQTIKNRKVLLEVYDLFKSHFTTTQKANLNAMVDDLSNTSINDDTVDLVNSKMTNIADVMAGLMENLK